MTVDCVWLRSLGLWHWWGWGREWGSVHELTCLSLLSPTVSLWVGLVSIHVLRVSIASFCAVWQRAPSHHISSHHISSPSPGTASAWPSHHASPCGSRRKVTLRAHAAGANSTLGGQVTAWVAQAAPCHLGSNPAFYLLPAGWVSQGLSSPTGHQ